MAAHCAWTDGPCWPATGSSCNLERPIGRVCAFFLRCETNARWTEEERERGKWELDREIFSHCVRCETKCSLDERENVSALPGKFSLRPLRDQMLAGQKEETGKRKMGAWPGDFLTLRPLWDQMLAGRKRKRKCSTGKVLTASAVRPNARWTKRGNREEEMGAWPGDFLTLRPLWDQMLAGRKRKRKCSTGKFSLRPLRDQMLAGQKEETGKRKMGAWPGDFLTLLPLWDQMLAGRSENVSALPGKFSLRPLRDQMLAGQKERLLK